MGNRAVITTSASRSTGIGIYLHWNGGLESVLAFLAAAKARGYRRPDPNGDTSYAMARLCGLICEFTGLREETGIGIGTLKELDTDNYDNGTYVIGGDWELLSRWGRGRSCRKTVEELDERERMQYDGILVHLK